MEAARGSVHRCGASGGFGGTIWLFGARRFGRSTFTSKCSGLCGGSPFRRSRFALLRTSACERCNRLTISGTECVDHKLISLRSSSSVQRDIWASPWRPPASRTCQPIRVATLAIAFFSTALRRPAWSSWRSGERGRKWSRHHHRQRDYQQCDHCDEQHGLEIRHSPHSRHALRPRSPGDDRYGIFRKSIIAQSFLRRFDLRHRYLPAFGRPRCGAVMCWR